MDRNELIEAASKAAAISDGWENWETATCVADTLNGNAPDEERTRYREWVTDVLSAIEAQGLAVVPVEATKAMADIGTKARWQSAVRDADNVREIYRAMIEAGKV